MGERMIAEIENRKKDTTLLGSQLQEVYVRNEKLSNSIEERNSALLEAKDRVNALKTSIETIDREKRQLRTQRNQLSAQNVALSNTLSYRQLNEQKLNQYARRLETAIREQSVFPQIQARVSELEQEQNTDVVF